MNKIIIKEINNPISRSEDNNLIDVEILTENFGWIPTTVSFAVQDDAEHVLQIKQWLHENVSLIAPYVPPVVDYAVERVKAKSAIDTAAGSARQRFVSAGQLIEEEYRLALQQVQAWRAAGSPAEDVPAAITGWIGATSMTAEQAAVDIEQTAAAWEQALLQIRSLRLEGKAMVDAAADDATEITTIAGSYVQKLNDIKPVSA